ncbi:hypothetical protein [Fodinibius halophilus]|uniref:Uncharacterized protein n=1 Tax=Fodinibius halophilus TaxID=1736908 RepID=A0A6M1TBI5_9BACT|nr:hypothetical protein [Fodinibius halophilus]NGP87652.1 hypothetical protein [Fodinibius halophilus]
MIKKAVTIALILSVLGSLVRFAMPLTWYIANYDYITSELCVNRDNPDIECDGMCQLEKKMHERQEKQAQEVPHQRVDRQARILLFFTDTVPPVPNFSRAGQSIHIANIKDYSLWLSEPPSPPPQIG